MVCVWNHWGLDFFTKDYREAFYSRLKAVSLLLKIHTCAHYFKNWKGITLLKDRDGSSCWYHLCSPYPLPHFIFNNSSLVTSISCSVVHWSHWGKSVNICWSLGPSFSPSLLCLWPNDSWILFLTVEQLQQYRWRVPPFSKTFSS